jgi:IS1 family transposase
MAIFILCNTSRGLDSESLANIIGVSQSSTWLLIQRIYGLVNVDEWEKLDGIVEVDETFVGGKSKHKHITAKLCKSPNEDKTLMLGMKERNGNVIFKVINGRKYEDLVIARNYIKNTAIVYTDAWKPYEKVFKNDYKDHQSVLHSKKTKRTEEERISWDGKKLPAFYYKKQWAKDSVVWTNGIEGMFSRLKDAVGNNSGISAEHIERYANMVSFRHRFRKLSAYKRMEELLSNMERSKLSYDDVLSWAGKDAHERRKLREEFGAPEQGKLYIGFRKDIAEYRRK